jgi:hypothetical protein
MCGACLDWQTILVVAPVAMLLDLLSSLIADRSSGIERSRWIAVLLICAIAAIAAQGWLDEMRYQYLESKLLWAVVCSGAIVTAASLALRARRRPAPRLSV